MLWHGEYIQLWSALSKLSLSKVSINIFKTNQTQVFTAKGTRRCLTDSKGEQGFSETLHPCSKIDWDVKIAVCPFHLLWNSGLSVLPWGNICSYNTMFKSLCPSSYCCDLCLRARGQKVSNGALDLVCHVLPRLLLILLLWPKEELGSCTPFIPAAIKVYGSPVCLLCVSVCVCVCSCVCNCIVSDFLSTLS